MPEIHPQPGVEYFLNMRFLTKEATPIIAEGHEVAWEQFKLPYYEPAASVDFSKLAELNLSEKEDFAYIKGQNFSITIDKETGEIIKAWVVLRDDKKGSITEDELLAWCKENMTGYKVPRHIEFRDSIPKSLIGKVLRREIQEADPIWIAAHKDDS